MPFAVTIAAALIAADLFILAALKRPARGRHHRPAITEGCPVHDPARTENVA